MHELSIVEALLGLCEENAKANKASAVDEVHVKIGRLSGIETELFKRSFETFKQKTICENARLFIGLAPLVAKCDKCAAQSELKENIFLCPECGSNELKIIDGEDFYLMRLIMR